MAHFFTAASGQAGEATRVGSKRSGVRAYVQTWTGRIVASMHHDDETGQDLGRVTITSGPSGFYTAEVELTGAIDVSALAQASVFDPETARHLRQARLSVQRANAAALKAIARRDRLAQARKAA